MRSRAMRLSSVLVAVALLAHGAAAFRAHGALGAPRLRHIVSARGTRATLGETRAARAGMRMRALSAGQAEPSERTVGRRQRFVGWLRRRAYVLFISVALIKALAFSGGGGAAHAGQVAEPVVCAQRRARACSAPSQPTALRARAHA